MITKTLKEKNSCNTKTLNRDNDVHLYQKSKFADKVQSKIRMLYFYIGKKINSYKPKGSKTKIFVTMVIVKNKEERTHSLPKRFGACILTLIFHNPYM